MVSAGAIIGAGILLTIVAASIFLRRELGETGRLLGGGFSSLGQGLGRGFSGVAGGISSLLSPQIRPTFVPTIGFNVVGTFNRNENTSPFSAQPATPALTDLFGGNQPTRGLATGPGPFARGTPTTGSTRFTPAELGTFFESRGGI